MYALKRFDLILEYFILQDNQYSLQREFEHLIGDQHIATMVRFTCTVCF